MKCSHCNSKWETDASVSSSLVNCPFCGKSLANEEDPKFYENSRDALAAIMRTYGAEVLLGKLTSHFPDFAPSVSKNVKKLVYAVYENDAAKVLKSNLEASQPDKERAVKIAVQKLTEAFIVPDMAETIIHEFTAALGWQVIKPTPPLKHPAPPPEKPTGTVTPPSAKPQPEKKPVQSAPSGSVITYSNATGITAKIINGEKRNLEFGSYKWRVLNVQSDKALLITEDVIDQRTYNKNWTYITWETCTLRQYLNGEFYNKFNSGCKAQILFTNNNPDNPKYGMKGGNNTQDHIFLLSIDEVKKYFINDSDRKANHAGNACWWWLRSPGGSSYCAANVVYDGFVDVYGCNVTSDSGGVRPAFWLNLKS